MELELAPKAKRAKGQVCCEPVVHPDVEREQAQRMAAIAKALADPIRIQLLDVLRKHAGRVCVCELVPLFDVSQPTISHHLRVLRQAGLVESEKRGLWVFYYVLPRSIDELAGWLHSWPVSTTAPPPSPDQASEAHRGAWPEQTT